MSRHYFPHQPPIIVTDNDVLCGRGVNIAAHPGNERFRTLVTTRADHDYCDTYSVSEKKAVAEQIVRHIESLNPPGRFLKREGRGQVSRGLNGPWEELTHREAVKKTCQALRDCNRSDRATYANGVEAPPDVAAIIKERQESGLTGKDYAAKAAEELKQQNQLKLRQAMEAAGVTPDQIEEQLRRQSADPTYVVPGFTLTAEGDYQPIAIRTPMEGVAVGLDGMPIRADEPIIAAHMPIMFSAYPHPAMDAPPIDEAASAAARIAAGYIHPSERSQHAVRNDDAADAAAAEAAAAEAEEEAAAAAAEEAAAAVVEEAAAAAAEEAAAVAAEEAAAAVAALDSAAIAHHEQVFAEHDAEGVADAHEAAEIAVVIAQDAVDALANVVKEEPGVDGSEVPELEEGGEDVKAEEGKAEVKFETDPAVVKAEGVHI